MDILKRKNRIIKVAFIFYILLYFLLIIRVLPKYSTIINGIFITVVAISSFILYDFKKFEFNNLNKQITRLVFYSFITYFTIIYILGLFTGFGRSVYSNKIFSIIKNIFIPLLSALALEFTRYLYISNNKDSKKRVYFITFLIIIFDIILNFYIFDFTLRNFFIYITVTLLPIIFRNILLSYLTYKIGYYPCIIYVVTFCIYNYAIMYKPNLGNYLTCIVNVAYPALIYIYSSRDISNYKSDDKNKDIKKVLKIIFLDIPLLLAFTIFIGLISGYFRYHLIGVDTSQISPKIKRGDAVMIDRNYDYDEYKKGDIIAYRSGKKIVIDVVSKKTKDELGYETVCVTKVINKGAKNTYKEISEEKILGKYVNFKVRKIAYPTIKFKEFIRGDLN